MSELMKSYIKEKDFVTREIAGETIIVPIRNKVGDLDSIYTLNEIGTVIWDLIDGKNSVGEIAKAVCNAYEVTPEQAEKDVVEFVNTVAQAGLIKLPKE